jgi:hypothetical protein
MYEYVLRYECEMRGTFTNFCGFGLLRLTRLIQRKLGLEEIGMHVPVGSV